MNEHEWNSTSDHWDAEAGLREDLQGAVGEAIEDDEFDSSSLSEFVEDWGSEQLDDGQ